MAERGIFPLTLDEHERFRKLCLSVYHYRINVPAGVIQNDIHAYLEQGYTLDEIEYIWFQQVGQSGYRYDETMHDDCMYELITIAQEGVVFK